MNVITTICRILVGVLFILSGLIKANDPMGFAYKLDEYWIVFHVDFMKVLSLYFAIFICVFEIAVGFATLMGAKIRWVAWTLLVMIVFFSFLTFYSAYFNKVTDCGCFGDALHLTPWQSFSKDMILLVLIGVIFFRRNHISPLIGETAGTFLTIVVFGTSLWFSVRCVNHLPVVDFRPYAVGKNLIEGMKLPPGAKTDSIQMVFVYEKGGKQVELSQEQVMNIDDSYKFITRKDKMIREGDHPAIHDFKMDDADHFDHAQEILSDPGYHFLLVSYDLKKADRKVQAQINQFVKHCDQKKIKFIGLTANTPEETDVFRHDVEAMYDFYYCDNTALKTIIRSNPGLVLLKGATVVDMWHYNDFPEFKDFEKKYLDKN